MRLIAIGFAASLLPGPLPASATELTPDFATVPTGWFADRYAPHDFALVGSYEGRDGVLGISISAAEGSANRPLSQQGSFYNTQGMKYVVNGGAGSMISAQLFIPQIWSDPAAGARRTDLWGTMWDGTQDLAFPVLGFTNYGGAARLRAFGDTGWVDLAAPIQYDTWNTLEIGFTGTSLTYAVNGTILYTDETVDGITGFKEVMIQAYNFADPGLGEAVATDYVAYWANNEVPEPAGILALGTGLLGLGLVRYRPGARRSAVRAGA